MRAACCEATVLRHEVIADDIRLLTALWPDREHVPHAGQFFTLRAWGADEAPFLSRPISVHKWDAETQTVEFLYAVVGEGTRKLTALKKGDSFQLTGPMGNGFDVADILSKYQKIAVVGGGIGTAPMYQLTRRLAASSRTSSSASAISPTAWKSIAPSRASSRCPPTPARWVSTVSSPSCMTRRITMWCWCAAPRS